MKQHVHTMVFGHLALQIVSIKRFVLASGPWNDALVQMWQIDLQPVG